MNEPKEKKHAAILTEGSIFRTVVKLTGPMVWGLLAIISLNLVDTFFIAQLGKDQLAAMTYSLPIVMVLMSLSLGLSVGTGSVVSRAIGSGDHHRVEILTTSSMLLTFVIMSSLVGLCLPTINFLFQIFNPQPEVMPYIHAYMTIWYLGMPAMGLAMIGNAALTSSGKVKLPAAIMILVAFLNLILDPLLIFGLLGFPEMGMQGAALATALSYGVAFFISFWAVAFKKEMLTFHIPLSKMWQGWKDILHISIPAGCSQMIVPVTSAFTVWMLSHFGPGVVGGYGIVSRIEAFVLIVVIGLSHGLAPFIGQNWGAGHYGRVKHSVSLGYQIAILWGGLVALLLGLGRQLIPKVFMDDPTVVSTVSLYLTIVPISYCAAGSLFVTNAFLNAIGMSRAVAAMTIIRYFVLYIPLAILSMKMFGPIGIFFTISFVNLFMGLSAYLWSRNIPHQFQLRADS